MTDGARKCHRCGASLNPDEARGLCPACLLESSLAGDEEPGLEDAAGTSLLDSERPAKTPGPAEKLQRLGDYELLEEIGRGGMGVIYRARQASLDRFVALKTILTGPLASADFAQRFQTEAHAAAVLDHPNIVPIYEVGDHLGQPFYSMRLVVGRNLAQELKETGPMAPRRAAQLLGTVARAVHYAHQRGVLHRDLKPANILLDAEGNPHVTDFGLAKLLEQDDGLTLTQAALGTPNYMAPEQADGAASTVTTVADVYSLGAILFELLTGRKLFTAPTPLATINQAREHEPPKPSSILRMLPRDLDTICWKCLEKEPRRRYATALALAEDLERWLKGEPIRARRVGAVERVGLWCRRKPAMAGMAGTALLAVLVVSGISAWRLMVAREQKQLEQYAASLSLADSYIRDGATDRALELLLQCPEHLRHWEWGRLVYLCHQEIATIPAHTNVARWLTAPLIHGMAISHDGTRLISVGLDLELKLWDTLKQELLCTIGNATNQAVTWEFSPGGEHLALGMANGALRVIDAAKGAPVWAAAPDSKPETPQDNQVIPRRRVFGIDFDSREDRPYYELLPKRPESIVSLGYSPDGRRIAAAAGNQQIVIRDAITGTEQARWQHHLTKLERLWFTPDGSMLVAKAKLGYELIESASGVSKATNVWQLQEADALIVDATGSNALTFDFASTLHLWKDGVERFPLAHTYRNNPFFDPAGRRVCVTGPATKAGVFDVASGRLAFAITHDVNGGAFSASGDRLITFGPDRLIRLWDTAGGVELRVLRGHLSVPEISAFSSDGHVIATGSRDGIVKLWTGWPGRELVRCDSLPMLSPYSSDGRLWATAPNLNGIYVREADSGKAIAEFPFKKQNTLSMAFSPDGNFLVTVGAEKLARIWDVRTQRLAGLLRGHDRSILSVTWSADGRWIATGDFGGVARIWDAASRREWKTVKAHHQRLLCLQFDPAGRRLLTSGSGQPRLWDAQTGNLVWTLDDDNRGSAYAAFSADGRRVACAGVDRQIRIWDARTGKLEARWPTRSQGIAFCNFSPDSRRLVVPVVDNLTGGAAAPFLEIWDTEHGRQLLDLRGHTDFIYGSLFSPVGDRILSGAMDRTMRQWETFPWRQNAYAKFPGANVSERIRNYSTVYWRERMAREKAAALESPPQPLGSVYKPTPREWETLVRPARSPDASPNLLNLDPFYTGALDSAFRPEGAGWEGDDDLSQLPTGVVTLDGIEFDVRGVVLLRIGPPGYWFAWREHPVRVEGIHVGKAIRRLHVLHAAVDEAAASTPIGSYVLHYADGSEQELEIVYGRDLRHWWLGGRGDLEEASHARVAWTGTNPFAELCEAQVRLFHRTYDNPRPDVEVVSVDFVSKEAPAAPFVVAMTVEP